MALPPTTNRSARQLWALLALPLSSYILASRYYTSAAFERPLQLTTYTLLISGLYYLYQQTSKVPLSQEKYVHDVFATLKFSRGRPSWREFLMQPVRAAIELVYLLPRSVAILVACIVARSFFFWSATSDTPCSRNGAQALLPLFVVLIDTASAIALERSIGRPLDLFSFTSSKRSDLRAAAIYTFFALLWASWAMPAVEQSTVATGTPCVAVLQPAWFLSIAPFITCVFDAAIIVFGSRQIGRTLDDDSSLNKFLAGSLLPAGLLVSLLGLPIVLVDGNIFFFFHAHYSSFQDLVIDSAMASTALLSAVSLLGILHPTTIAALVSSPSVLVSLFPQTRIAQLPDSGSSSILGTAGVAMIAVGLMGWQFCSPMSPATTLSSSVTTVLHRWLIIAYIAFFTLFTIVSVFINYPTTDLTVSSLVKDLVSKAQVEHADWASQAATSKSLATAIDEYQKRYRIPPPPGFGMWFRFAKERGSVILDDFEQIHQDLLPFWGMKPGEIRDITSQLLKYPALGVGGMRIRGGRVEQSPHIPGTHRWMTNSIQAMIEPFAQWLPDMDFVVNLADESRVSVNFESMEVYKKTAEAARRRALRNSLHGGAPVIPTHRDGPAWPENFPEPVADEASGRIPSQFTNYLRKQLYYDIVAPACSPVTLARNSRWWDRSKACTRCTAPHSVTTREGTILVNTTLANDLCHQPDVAYLHGYMSSPATMVGTNSLVPIFSQGRVGGFSDILIPSPWNFDDKSDYDAASAIEWTSKRNTLFWRGSSSDGYAADGSWAGFTRTRLVKEGFEKETGPPSMTTGVNVSFTGNMNDKCHQADCASRRHFFPLWAEGAVGPIQQPAEGDVPLPEVTFEENWRYRHLIDMDGAGFSGRFLAFLQSHSLIYRATIFRTWYEERLSAWHHYVPVDIRLGSGFWALVNFFGGEGEGDVMAQNISEQGREWANKVLRHDDMQIYLFRLLIEWGRLTNDDREFIRHRG